MGVHTCDPRIQKAERDRWVPSSSSAWNVEHDFVSKDKIQYKIKMGWARETAQQIKSLDAILGDPSWTPGAIW